MCRFVHSLVCSYTIIVGSCVTHVACVFLGASANVNLDEIDPDQHLINCILPVENRKSLYYTVEEYNTDIYEANNFFIINYNVRSFNRNFDTFDAMLCTLKAHPDLMVLSETWLVEAVQVDGYRSFHTFRTERRSGGISVFCKETLQSSRMDVYCVSSEVIESCAVRVIVSGIKYIILAIYRPHSGSICEFNSKLRDLLSNFAPNDNVCVVGDLNINLLDLDNSDIRTFSALMRSFNLVPVITEPTRFPPASLNQLPSLLDHIWITTSNDVLSKSGIILYDGTDHCPSFLTFSNLNKGNPNDKIKITFRLVNKDKSDEFMRRVLDEDWDSLVSSGDVNNITVKYLNRLNELYCSSFPLKIKYIGVKRLNKPWLTPALLCQIKEKSFIFKRFKLGLVSECVNKSVRNRVNVLVKKAREKYYKSVFDNCSGNIGKTWNTIRKIISASKSATNVVSGVRVDEVYITRPDDISRAFNSYFSGISAKIDGTIPAVNDSPLHFVHRNVQSSIFLNPVSSVECDLIIKSLKNKKSDINTISVKALKMVSEVVSVHFSDIINKSFRMGTFPDILKRAVVVPVYKKGDSTNVENYRPISLLSVFSKVVEKCMASRLKGFLQEFSILTGDQYGFREGSSTVDALIDYVEFLYECLENKKHAISVFADFSKAFDSVNHCILLEKLESYGIRGVAHSWFASYLMARTQHVKVGSSFSEESVMSSGVPQGSVLGPILYLMYVNELPGVAPNLKTTLFADDTTLTAAGADIVPLMQKINVELGKFVSWTFANRLSLNAVKTNVMLFSNRVPPDVVSAIVVNGVNLNFSESTKFLGLEVDKKLKFNVHLSTVSDKLSKVVGIMYKLSQYLSQKSLVKLYYSLFYPYVIYCNLIWGETYDVHINTVDMLQKKVIRIITGSGFLAHTEPLFLKAEILKVCDVHRFLLGVYMYKNLSSFDLPDHSYDTRQSTKPTVNYGRLTLSRHSIGFAGPRLWNTLPDRLKCLPSLYAFRKSLKKYLVSFYATSP